MSPRLLLALGVVVAAGAGPATVTNHASFLVSTQVCGMGTSYALERDARHEILFVRTLEQSHDGLAVTLRGLRGTWVSRRPRRAAGGSESCIRIPT